MKILIIGSTGLLGQALVSRLAPRGRVTGLSRRSVGGGSTPHLSCDLLDAAHVASVMRELSPDLVVNAQALSDVDRCEQAPDEAEAQNVETVANVVRALAGGPSVLMHVSTDYVFDGSKGRPYVESDPARPLSAYGRSKVRGEAEALKHARAVVVRTSTLFGPARMNFCDWTATQLLAGQPVEAFTDQVTSPTYTGDAAEAIGELGTGLVARWQERGRVYHAANTGAASRVAFAERVASLLGRPRELIRRIPMASQRRPAPRPAYSALDSAALAGVIGRGLRSWDDALEAYLRERRWLNSPGGSSAATPASG